MQDDLCELRFDVPLPAGADVRGFEAGWRETLAAQKLTALVAPPAAPVSARFRVCGPGFESERLAAWNRYLTARLTALPGAPSVAAEQAGASPDWRGVRIWLAYRSRDLSALLKKSSRKSHPSRDRGRRP